MNDVKFLIDELNAPIPGSRLAALKTLMARVEAGDIPRPVVGNDFNNHIHTIYSFSPYSPAKAIWLAWRAGLRTAGIVDHDSVSGVREFVEAGKIAGVATTVGVECRVDMSRTPLVGRRVNNTDQDSIAYVVIHGVPHTAFGAVTDFFRPYAARRNARNREMTEAINGRLAARGIQVNFERDIVPLSEFENGGSITERHISLALARKFVGRFGKGLPLVAFMKDALGLAMNARIAGLLSDPENSYYEYDLLGFIKSDFIASFYIDATRECPDVREFVAFSKRIGGVPAYAYLGDVTDSITGDKRPQRFEDGYLDELFEVIAALGFSAVTYMPPRNTAAQLARVRELCDRYSMLQISGVDINSPRQSFLCEEMRGAEFDNLRDATWALIGHERSAADDVGNGMFSERAIRDYPSLAERIAQYKKIGLDGYVGP